jgi:beta-lactamase regulating signal transducer with metallopeptidase domain
MTLLPPAWPGFGDALATIAGLGLTFLLHATVLLLAVWTLERLGWLKEPAWAEWAWRLALFGAFVSVAVEAMPRRAPGADASQRQGAIVDMRTADTADVPVSAVRAETPAVVGDSVPPVVVPPQAGTASGSTSTSISTRASAAPFALRAPDALLLALLALWSLGSAVSLVRVLHQSRGMFRLRARLVREGIEVSSALRDELHALAAAMHVRTPVMRLLPDLRSPLVLPNAILLPRWAEALDPRQRRAMLAHELAHLRRRDPLWRPLQRLACVPLFFHPLAWTAVRRLEALAETLCDRSAAERSGGGRPLAECLAECLARSAASTPTPRSAGWALAMAEHDAGIVSRVKDLLENPHMKMSSIPTRWRWTAAGVALLALIALPGVLVIARPGGLPGMLDTHNLSVTIRRDGSTHTVRSDLPERGERFRLRMDGDIAFTPREDDIARMADDATFSLLQTRGGTTRELVIDPAANGARRAYRVNGVARPFDAEAKAWLATAIPEIHRLTGIDADARIRRMLAAGGVPRVLAEIGLLRTDYGRGRYITALSRLATFDDAQMAAAIAAAAKIGSDYEQRHAMAALLGQARISPANQAALLAAAGGIDSDFERSEWLIAAAGKLPVDSAGAAAWQAALLASDNDFERRRALQALIERGQPRAAAVSLALRSMRGMGSDFERRSVLETAAKSTALQSDADYFAVVEAMDGDFERREALIALIRAGAPDVARSRGVIDSVRALDSDFERGEVLQALAKVMPNDPALIEAYRAATRAMASQHERGQAEQALDRFYRS